mmetsp:Transcript_14613/g.34756  ORF Transcript_14613/g.34756 Transcript_14613/m.34756 type:complete len:173 (-) Transcript_14613:72-590(-)
MPARCACVLAWHGGEGTVGAAVIFQCGVKASATAHYRVAEVGGAMISILPLLGWKPLPLTQRSAWAARLIESCKIRASGVPFGEPLPLGSTEAPLWDLAAIKVPLLTTKPGAVYITLTVEPPPFAPGAPSGWGSFSDYHFAAVTSVMVGALGVTCRRGAPMFVRSWLTQLCN